MYDFLKFVHRKTYELEMIYRFHSENTHFKVKIQCNFENYQHKSEKFRLRRQ